MPHFIVEDIEFDFTDGQGEIHPDDQYSITYDTLGVWYVEEESELVDKITDTMGWCVKSIKYVPNQPHRLTAFM